MTRIHSSCALFYSCALLAPGVYSFHGYIPSKGVYLLLEHSSQVCFPTRCAFLPGVLSYQVCFPTRCAFLYQVCFPTRCPFLPGVLSYQVSFPTGAHSFQMSNTHLITFFYAYTTSGFNNLDWSNFYLQVQLINIVNLVIQNSDRS